MTGSDQLGLFMGDSAKSGISSATKKLSISIEFANNSMEPKIEELVKKISKDISDLDHKATVTSKMENLGRPWMELGFLAVDVETTGLDAANNRVIELALVPFNMSFDAKPFSQLFSVSESLPEEITRITGITDDMLRDQPSFADCADDALRLLRKASFAVAYNAKFDQPFLESELARLKKVLPDIPWIDPFVFICELDRYKRGKKLSDAARRWGVNLTNAHRALDDAQAAGNLMLKMAEKIDCYSLYDLLERQKIWQWQNAHNLAELKRSSNWAINR